MKRGDERMGGSKAVRGARVEEEAEEEVKGRVLRERGMFMKRAGIELLGLEDVD